MIFYALRYSHGYSKGVIDFASFTSYEEAAAKVNVVFDTIETAKAVQIFALCFPKSGKPPFVLWESKTVFRDEGGKTMIDTEERRAELHAAYDTLVAFNLWRRGKIEAKYAADPQEIGEAIDTAAGVLWEVINGRLSSLEYWKDYIGDCTENLRNKLKKAETERDQARKALADLWKQCRDTLAEDDEHETDPKI